MALDPLSEAGQELCRKIAWATRYDHGPESYQVSLVLGELVSMGFTIIPPEEAP